MHRKPQYRIATPPEQSQGWQVRVWHVLFAVPVLTILVTAFITGPVLPIVISTAFGSVWAILIILPATMLGLVLTKPLTQNPCIQNSPWSDAWRIIISAALGLGAISLGMLLLGSLHGIHHVIPGLMLIIFAGLGYPATSQFIRDLNLEKLRQPLQIAELSILFAALPLACLLTASTFPPGTLWHTEGNGYDVLEYHLQLARQFSAANSTSPVSGNIYSFLPLNIELLYTLIASLARSVAGPGYLYSLIYGAQALHAAITVGAAIAIGLIPIHLSRIGRILAILTVLSVPWTLVIGSLAYNDGAVLFYGAIAFGLVVGEFSVTVMLTLGILLGLAVSCKMTAGVMICVPISAILLVRAKFRQLAVITAVALVVYSPWAVRSMIFTHTAHHFGNPIFPIFSGTLGQGHWSHSLAIRFDRGHRPPVRLAGLSGHLSALVNQSLLDRQWSPGFAAFAGLFAYPPRFSSDLDWPSHLGILWMAIFPAIVLAMFRGRIAFFLLIFLLVQILAWLTCTQLQSRFLLPAILPIALILGLAADALPAFRHFVLPVVAIQAIFCGFLLWPEAGLLAGPRILHRPAAIGEIFSLPGDWILSPVPSNIFTDDSVIYLEGYSAPLYVHGRVIYNTIFNRNRLARVLKRGGPATAIEWLRQHHVHYLIVDWSEIHRLSQTYGFDPIITPDNIARMIPLGLHPINVRTANGIQIFILMY